jgi:hypothetical protein
LQHLRRLTACCQTACCQSRELGRRTKRSRSRSSGRRAHGTRGTCFPLPRRLPPLARSVPLRAVSNGRQLARQRGVGQSRPLWARRLPRPLTGARGEGGVLGGPPVR